MQLDSSSSKLRNILIVKQKAIILVINHVFAMKVKRAFSFVRFWTALCTKKVYEIRCEEIERGQIFDNISFKIKICDSLRKAPKWDKAVRRKNNQKATRDHFSLPAPA